jgi:uncharacterized protein YicC (UPF0701 family)
MRSMTGFGAGAAEGAGVRLTVEIRGVNQRHLDVRIAAPREYACWEADLRDRVRAHAERGRVEAGGRRGQLRVPLYRHAHANLMGASQTKRHSHNGK